MGKTKPNDHDEVVIEVGKALKAKGLDDVQVDLDAEHGFKPKLVLSVKPPEVLSAFVPTGALFEPNFDWKTPDLAVTRDGFTYVLEVYSANDPFTSICRKIETVIANSDSEKHKIVGMAIIKKPCTSKPEKPKSKAEQEKAKRKAEQKAEQLDRMRGTFHRLFGKSNDASCPEKCRTYLQPLFSHSAVCKLYGKINWDAVLEMSIDDDDWAGKLYEHVDKWLKAEILLAPSA